MRNKLFNSKTSWRLVKLLPVSQNCLLIKKIGSRLCEKTRPSNTTQLCVHTFQNPALFVFWSALRAHRDTAFELVKIYRGYYTAARRYEFYFRVVKTIFYERAQRVSKILFLPLENKIHIFKPLCNFLFII